MELYKIIKLLSLKGLRQQMGLKSNVNTSETFNTMTMNKQPENA